MICPNCNTALYAMEKVLKLLESKCEAGDMVEERWTLVTAINTIKSAPDSAISP